MNSYKICKNNIYAYVTNNRPSLLFIYFYMNLQMSILQNIIKIRISYPEKKLNNNCRAFHPCRKHGFLPPRNSGNNFEKLSCGLVLIFRHFFCHQQFTFDDLIKCEKIFQKRSCLEKPAFNNYYS